MNTSLNSQKMKINFLNLFYNQRICLLSKSTTLLQLFKTPAILSLQTTCIDDLENEENLLNSIVKAEGN